MESSSSFAPRKILAHKNDLGENSQRWLSGAALACLANTKKYKGLRAEVFGLQDCSNHYVPLMTRVSNSANHLNFHKPVRAWKPHRLL